MNLAAASLLLLSAVPGALSAEKVCRFCLCLCVLLMFSQQLSIVGEGFEVEEADVVLQFMLYSYHVFRLESRRGPLLYVHYHFSLVWLRVGGQYQMVGISLQIIYVVAIAIAPIMCSRESKGTSTSPVHLIFVNDIYLYFNVPTLFHLSRLLICYSMSTSTDYGRNYP